MKREEASENILTALRSKRGESSADLLIVANVAKKDEITDEDDSAIVLGKKQSAVIMHT